MRWYVALSFALVTTYGPNYHGPVLVVKVDVVDQHQFAFLDLPRSESVRFVELGFVFGPHFFRSRHRPLHVFLPPLKLSDACCQQLLSTEFISLVNCHPGGNHLLHRHDGFLSEH